MILPMMRRERWGARVMQSQPSTPRTQDNCIVLLGPHWLPRYPPSRQPIIWPMLTLLAKRINRWQWSKTIYCIYTKPRQLFLGSTDCWKNGGIWIRGVWDHLLRDVRYRHRGEAHVVSSQHWSKIHGQYCTTFTQQIRVNASKYFPHNDVEI